jgi:hypothetical protein
MCQNERFTLQPTAENFHDASNLAQADDSVFGKIADVDFSEKWHQVMLAHGKDINILHNNHFFVILGKNGVVQNIWQST